MIGETMTFNTSTMSDAIISELAATVQHSAAGADLNDENRHGSQLLRPQADALLREATASVLMGTQELFSGDVAIEAVDDPEISGSRY